MTFFDALFSFFTKKEVYGLLLIIAFGILIIVLGKYLINKIVLSAKSEFEKKRRKTIVSLLSNILKYGVFVIVVLFILNLYGVDTKALIASLGVIGAVLGLALQDTIKDLICGIAIIMDNYFVVGDIITIHDFTGEVIDMGLKSTKIKKYTGEIYILANHTIDSVINLSQTKANLVIDIPTAYEENTEHVEKVLEEILKEIKKIKGVKNTSYLGISSLGDSQVNYSIRITCDETEQWQIKRDILRIIKTTYDKENIKIPYPQIEVHNGKKI